MKLVIFLAATLLATMSFAAEPLFSSRNFSPRMVPTQGPPRDQERLAQDDCLKAAMVAVTQDLSPLMNSFRPTALAHVDLFYLSGALFATIDLDGVDQFLGPVRWHWLIPISVRKPNQECLALPARMSAYDDLRGGGGVSVHN